MQSKLFWAAPLAALAISAGAAQIAGARSPVQPDTVETKPQRSCFWARNANGFAAADEKTVNIRVGVKDVYQFEMLGRCTDIDWSQKIALVSRGSSSICTGLDAEIVTNSALGPQRCPVRAVRKLTPQEVAALTPRARP